METGWCKDEEREVLHAWGFDVWDLPAGACLATRIPCGEALTAEKLHTVRMCEDYLHGLGLRQVRVRIDGGMARVSVGKDELESSLFDTAAEDAPSLPLDVVRELERQGDLKVDPIVRAYIHGEGNGRN